jgi:F5/8 type C domain.
MKKSILSIIAVIVIAALSTVAVFADYPASPEWDFALPTDASLLVGEVIGTEPWGGGDAVAANVFDGDTATFFDPAGVGEANYAGQKLDQAYILTEVRVMSRDGFLDRFNGATIQGSNDGETWTDIFVSAEAAPIPDYNIIKADQFIDGANTGYSYFRYCNNLNHGDVAEVEFYGNPAGAVAPAVEEAAPVAEEAPAVEEVAEVAPAEEAAAEAPAAAPATSDTMVVITIACVVALVAIALIKRKAVK